MTNRQIVQEALVISGSLLLSILLCSALTGAPANYYLSDVFIGSRPRPAGPADLFEKINVAAGLLFFFPVLFLINSIRLWRRSFAPDYLLSFHLFVSVISLIISLFAARYIEAISLLFGHLAVIYPPMSALQEQPPAWPELRWAAYAFCLVHCFVLAYLIRILVKRHEPYGTGL